MHSLMRSAMWAALVSGLLSGPAYTATLQVGPQRTIKLPSEAAKVARDGDVIAIEAGIYRGDVASWPQHGLTLKGIGQRAHIQAQGQAAEAKAIWVFKGNDITVENIELSGAAVEDLNGAGIRFEGRHLTLRNCHFHHNQMGLLTGANPLSEILIEGSEFNDNTVDYRRYGKLGHNIYIGNIKRFTLRNSYIHDASTGHNVKSRAQENHLLYNRISDERNGSSYLVDLPDGGNAYLIGNLLHQNVLTENPAMLAFAAEHHRSQANQQLYVVNNTFVNDRPNGFFLNNHSISPAILINNLLVGQATSVEGLSVQKHNLMEAQARFRNAGEYDYRLLPYADAIDQGIAPGQASNGFPLAPEAQYRHPLGTEIRRQQGAIDIGAYEFTGKQ